MRNSLATAHQHILPETAAITEPEGSRKCFTRISRSSFAHFGDFVLVEPLRTKWQVRNRLDSGSPGGARGSVTRGDSTAYGGPCRPMLPPLGLVEAMPTDNRSGRAVCGSWRALPAPSVRARAVTGLRHVFWLRFGLRFKMSRKQYLQP